MHVCTSVCLLEGEGIYQLCSGLSTYGSKPLINALLKKTISNTPGIMTSIAAATQIAILNHIPFYIIF